MNWKFWKQKPAPLPPMANFLVTSKDGVQVSVHARGWRMSNEDDYVEFWLQHGNFKNITHIFHWSDVATIVRAAE